VGSRADVWSLGVMLYELLTEVRPFRRNTFAGLLDQIQTEEPVPPGKLCEVPRELELICLHAMQKEPEMRYASGSEFAAEIARYLAGQPILTRASRLGRLRRSVARHPWIVTTVVLLSLAVWQVGRLRRPARVAKPELMQRNQRRPERQLNIQGRQNFEARLKPLRQQVEQARAAFYAPEVDIQSTVRRLREVRAQLQQLAEDPQYGQTTELWTLIGMSCYFIGDADRATEALRDLQAALRHAPAGWPSLPLARQQLEVLRAELGQQKR